ncbi:MAG: hypothetical protein Q4D43_09620 [Clostridia bacterium]|nr:hypothetical protein [Clostridia bacterium]
MNAIGIRRKSIGKYNGFAGAKRRSAGGFTPADLFVWERGGQALAGQYRLCKLLFSAFLISLKGDLGVVCALEMRIKKGKRND